MVKPVGDIRQHYRTCGKCGEYLRTQSAAHFRTGLHIHFVEYLGKELHAVVVIDCQKLVVLFLADFMGDGFSVDNGGHLVFALCFCWLYGDGFHFHFTSVFSFPVPAFVFVDV